MFRASQNPKMVEVLPKRHPYYTLLDEKPSINEEEVGGATYKTIVESAEFIARDSTLVIRARYVDGGGEEIFLHEYTALSLYGYLDEYMKALGILTGPAVGNA